MKSVHSMLNTSTSPSLKSKRSFKFEVDLGEFGYNYETDLEKNNFEEVMDKIPFESIGLFDKLSDEKIKDLEELDLFDGIDKFRNELTSTIDDINLQVVSTITEWAFYKEFNKLNENKKLTFLHLPSLSVFNEIGNTNVSVYERLKESQKGIVRTPAPSTNKKELKDIKKHIDALLTHYGEEYGGMLNLDLNSLETGIINGAIYFSGINYEENTSFSDGIFEGLLEYWNETEKSKTEPDWLPPKNANDIKEVNLISFKLDIVSGNTEIYFSILGYLWGEKFFIEGNDKGSEVYENQPCPNCSNLNLPISRYCSMCGYKLQEDRNANSDNDDVNNKEITNDNISEYTKELERELLEIDYTNTSADSKVNKIILTTCGICATVATQPIPFADIFILTPIQAIMGQQIAKARGVHLEKEGAWEIIKYLYKVVKWGTIAQGIAIGLYKIGLPGLGGFMTIPLVAGLTMGIGKVFDEYFKKQAHGQMLSEDEIKQLFKQGNKEGKKYNKAN